MSSRISGPSPIATYAMIVRNEQSQVARALKASPAEQRTVAAFQSDSISISQPTDLLLAKNRNTLQVVLGAYGLTKQANETGLLRQLLTQDPSATNSLVRALGSTADLHFVQAASARPTISFGFGDAHAASFTAGGSAASQIALNNLAWSSSDAQLTAAQPAKSWAYVLDDGTGAASIAQALTTAEQSTGTKAAPVTESYDVAPDGTITGSTGAPPITTATDSAGNTVYSLALASDAKGNAIRIASVVGVKVTPPANAPAAAADSLNAATAVPLLSAALSATGFNVVAQPNAASTGTTGFSIVNPIANGPLSLSQLGFSSYAATISAPILAGQTILPLGAAGLALKPGQVLLSGGTEIGTIKSIDTVGNITLASSTSVTGSAIAVAAGAQIQQAIGAGVSTIGSTLSASAAAPASGNTLALGSAASGLQPGQILTDGTAVLGIVTSVRVSGNVTLQANLAASVSAGDTIGVLPAIADPTTPGLHDAGNTANILTQYETGLYETQQDKLNPGMADALYFTRTMPSITSINQLMSDPRLLTVVTTNLGIAGTYGNLPFDEQQSLLTNKLNLSSLSTTSQIQHYAERFLALNSLGPTSGTGTADTALAILTGTSMTATTEDPASILMSALYPTPSNSNGLTGLLGALYA